MKKEARIIVETIKNEINFVKKGVWVSVDSGNSSIFQVNRTLWHCRCDEDVNVKFESKYYIFAFDPTLEKSEIAYEASVRNRKYFMCFYDSQTEMFVDVYDEEARCFYKRNLKQNDFVGFSSYTFDEVVKAVLELSVIV